MSTITPTITKKADLEYREGSSDKVYHVWIENVGANHFVKFKYGRRGSTLMAGTKIGPTHAAKAVEVYNKIVSEKTGKGYKPIPGTKKPMGPPTSTIPKFKPLSSSLPPGSTTAKRTTEKRFITSPQLLNPMSEKLLHDLIRSDKWVLQEKHDGKRMILMHTPNNKVAAWNKLGKDIEPPEEYCSALQKFKGYHFIIDGEACGPVFYVFDILQLESIDCGPLILEERLANLGMLMRSVDQDVIRMVATAETVQEKKSLLRELKERNAEGVVAKDLMSVYRSGRPASGGAALKFKFVESASCKVMKINDKRSVEVGLYIETKITGGGTKLVSVGNVTIPVNHEVPKVGDLVEVQYLYAYKGGSLYQPVYKGVRDDATVDSIKALKYKSATSPITSEKWEEK